MERCGQGGSRHGGNRGGGFVGIDESDGRCATDVAAGDHHVVCCDGGLRINVGCCAREEGSDCDESRLYIFECTGPHNITEIYI